MMSLDIQIVSLCFSFFFGIFFSLLLNINQKIIYSSKTFIKLFGTVLVVFLSVLIYFILLLYINNGIFHPYEMIMITLGFYAENTLHKMKNKSSL